jgi:hypothetical protein
MCTSLPSLTRTLNVNFIYLLNLIYSGLEINSNNIDPCSLIMNEVHTIVIYIY